MAIEQVSYLTYLEAVELHIKLMWRLNETRFGVFSRHLVESALARPALAARYEQADIVRQAATLFLGLIKNHPWVGGNKRTATFLMAEFLRRNRRQLIITVDDAIDLSLAVETDHWQMNEIESCLRPRVVVLKKE